MKCSTPTFTEVKRILDWLVKGKEGDLKVIHGDSFGWESREELLEAVAKPEEKEFRLIDPEMVGNGRGAETYLARILVGEVEGFPRMPYEGNIDGAYATDEEIAIIVAWIDSGALA